MPVKANRNIIYSITPYTVTHIPRLFTLALVLISDNPITQINSSLRALEYILMHFDLEKAIESVFHRVSEFILQRKPCCLLLMQMTLSARPSISQGTFSQWNQKRQHSTHKRANSRPLIGPKTPEEISLLASLPKLISSRWLSGCCCGWSV